MSMLTMFDSIHVEQIPGGPAAVAGYVNGNWPTYPALVAKFPHAHVLSIAVSSHADAECLDVEQGDATNTVAPAWVKRQLLRGVKRPVVYTSVSNVQALLRALNGAGLKRGDIRLWTAHYTFREHLCDSRCGFGMPGVADATQWTDKAFGRNLDQSIVADGFFTVTAAAVLEPAPVGEPKNQSPFTRRLWPVPVPAWFWAWAQWRIDGQDYQRPLDAPAVIPPWAWARLQALQGGTQ